MSRRKPTSTESSLGVLPDWIFHPTANARAATITPMASTWGQLAPGRYSVGSSSTSSTSSGTEPDASSDGDRTRSRSQHARLLAAPPQHGHEEEGERDGQDDRRQHVDVGRRLR